MKHCGTKYLETDRLILRRFKKEDAEAIKKQLEAAGASVELK